MSRNPYAGAPLQVTIFGVRSGEPVRSFMLMGGAPPAAVKAAQRGRPAQKLPGRAAPLKDAWPRTVWLKSDQDALRRAFGARWETVLTPRVGAVLGAAEPGPGATYTGAAEIDFGDLDAFDGDLAAPEPASQSPAESAGISPGLAGDFATVYSDVEVFPEDSFADLRLKIAAATKIPPYRQHIIYQGSGVSGDPSPDGVALRGLYRVSVGGEAVVTDIREFAAQLREKAGDAVAGIPVDRRLEESRDEVRVDPLESFLTLRESPGVYVRRVFVADLAEILRPPGGGAPGPLAQAMNDNLERDLFYYGCVMKFWPQTPLEAVSLAVNSLGAPDRETVRDRFPRLDPPPAQLAAHLAGERGIIDSLYRLSDRDLERIDAPVVGAPRGARQARGLRPAVTAATVTVRPDAARVTVALRAVLDGIPATRGVPAIVARLEERGEARLSRDRRAHVVEKTHVSAFSGAFATSLGRFLGRTPPRPSISFAVLRRANTGSEAPRGAVPRAHFVFLTIYPDGKYEAETTWREDDRVGFDAALAQVAETVRPIVAAVNAMGSLALPLGGTLDSPTSSRRRATIGSLTASTFWGHALNTAGFAALKRRWGDYNAAGIASVRDLQQGDAYSFNFRKGLTNIASRPSAWAGVSAGLDRLAILAGESRGPENLYRYYSDDAADARWRAMFPGRPVRIFHRMTDLRVEVTRVTLEEFREIHRYVFAFLDSLVRGQDRLPDSQRQPTSDQGRLRSLQERDPNLYALRKYDEDATVYSVLCQGDRQPAIVTAEEARRMSAKRRDNLVKFWNFTEDRPALYTCPSAKFPVLSFRAGEHPLGYCLPCCKKAEPRRGSRAAAVNDFCRVNHSLVDENSLELDADELAAAARHVLAYGKPVPPGRIGHPPPVVARELFFQALPQTFAFRLIGVPQSTPAVPAAGFFFSAAAILELSAETFAAQLAETCEATGETYRSLGGGAAGVFANASDLADTIRQSFAGAEDFTQFSPGGDAADAWSSIVTDLVALRYELFLVTFADVDGDVVFKASVAAAARLRDSAARPDVADPADVGVIVDEGERVYPLAAMSQGEFLRANIPGLEDPGSPVGGPGPARRIFISARGDADGAADEGPADSVVEILSEMAAPSGAAGPSAAPVVDLEFITRMCARGGPRAKNEFRVARRLINLRDFCYAVLLEEISTGDLAYFPVAYSPHAPPGDGAGPSAEYGPRPRDPQPAGPLARAFALANRQMTNPYRLEPTARLVDARSGDTVGFVAAAVAGKGGLPAGLAGGLYFHHDPVPPTEELPWSSAPAASLPYQMRDIDEAVFEAGGAPAVPALPPAKVSLVADGVRESYAYRFFRAEFAALLARERNDAVRREIADAFKGRLDTPENLGAARKSLAAILSARFPRDFAVISATVSSILAENGPAALSKNLAATLKASRFEFDRTTLTRLRSVALPEAHAAVSGLMRPRVTERDSTDAETPVGAAFFAACEPGPGDSRCDPEGRLIIAPGAFESLVSILTADCRDPSKNAALDSISGEIGGAGFTVRPGEKILVRPVEKTAGRA